MAKTAYQIKKSVGVHKTGLKSKADKNGKVKVKTADEIKSGVKSGKYDFSRVKSDLEKRINFDTFSKDISSMGKTIEDSTTKWQSKETLDNNRATIESIRDRASAYRQYVQLFGGGDSKAIKAIDDIQKYTRETLEGWDSLSETYGKYRDADSYNKAEQSAKKLLAEEEEMKTADLGKVKTEVTNLEDIYKKAKVYNDKITNGSMNIRSRSDYDRFEQNLKKITEERDAYVKSVGYDSYEELEKALGDKKKYLNRAEWLQKGVELASVGDKTSKNYDKDFAQKSKYVAPEERTGIRLEFGAQDDDVYKYINDETYRNDKAKFINGNADSSILTVGYEHMTPQERQTYNYYYNSGDKKKANEYLNTITESLGARKASADFDRIKGKTFDELTYGVVAGFDQFASGTKNLFNFSDEYIPVNSTQQLSGLVREDLHYEHGGWGSVPYDLITTTSNMLPSILVSSAIGTVNPVLGANVGAGLMGASAAGNAYQEMLNLGYDKSQARVYSTLTGISEAYLQRMMGGIGKLGGTGAKVAKMVQGIDNAAARFAIQWGNSIASESLEEGLQEVLNPFFKNFAAGYDTGAEVDWGEVFYSALLGGLSGGFLEGRSVAVNTYNQQVYNKGTGQNIRANDRVGDMLDFASNPEMASAYEAYSQYAKKGVNADNVSDYKLGRLHTEAMSDAQAVLNSKTSTEEERAKAQETIDQLKVYSQANVASRTGSAQNIDTKVIKDFSAEAIVALIDDGIESAEGTEAHTIATEIKARVENYDSLSEIATKKINGEELTAEETKALSEIKSKVSPKDITKIMDANDKAIRAEEAEDIAAKLVEKGESKEIADIVSRKMRGEVLTTEEAEKVVESEVALFVIAEVSNSENTTAEVMEASKGMDKDKGALFVSLYDGKTDVEAYTTAFNLAVMKTENNYGIQDILRTKNVLSNEQVGRIYTELAIKADQKQRVEFQKLAQRTANLKAYKGNIDDSVIDYNNTSAEGKVNWNDTRITPRMRKAITFLKGFAQATGINLKFVTNGKEEGFNGALNVTHNEITLDIFAGIEVELNQLLDTIIPTASHELTHWMETKSPVLFRKISNLVFETLEKADGINESGRIAREIKNLINDGTLKETDSESEKVKVARSEIVARACEDMLAQSKVGKDIFNSLSQKEQKTLVEKIQDIIQNIKDWVSEALGLYKNASMQREAEILRKYEDELDRLSKLWDEMLAESVEVNQALEKSGAFEHDNNAEGVVLKQARELQRKDPTKLTEEDFKSLLGFAEQKILADDTYIPARISTPQILIEFAKEQGYALENHPLAMRVYKARQALANEAEWDGYYKDKPHDLSIDEVVEIVKSMNNPSYLVYQTQNDRFAEIVKFEKDGGKQKAYAIIDFYDVDKNPEYMNGYKGGKYNILVTIYPSENSSELKEYLDNKNNVVITGEEMKKKAISQRGSGSFVPSHLNDIAFYIDSISNPDDIVKENFSDKDSTGRELSNVGLQIDEETESIAPEMLLSRRTWRASEYVKDRDVAINSIVKALDVSKEDAERYVDNINGIAKMIANDKTRLDYEPNVDENASALKTNKEYKWTVDMSTLCAKRLLFTGTFDAIQKRLPNTVFDSKDIVSLRSMMMERGYEVACGICYVESTRRELGPITAEFIKRYKLSQETGEVMTYVNSKGEVKELTKSKEQLEKSFDKSTDRFVADKDYTPTLADLNTTDIDKVKTEHPLVYEAYLSFMKARGQATPKLLETRTEYKGEILKHFKAKTAVDSRNAAGGLRVQSFSDFEVAHLIDMMQIILDMSRVGLMSQAYTKVPAFADVFGNTGMKINLSLIAKDSGLDADGNLIFDDVEGMPHKEAFRLRDKYSKNVGTILVGKNNAHIRAALADPRIDFIIPFHKSFWAESLYEALGLEGYEDYTDTQNEKPFDKSRKIKNFQPSEYWDYSKSGEENAKTYLKMCAEDGRIPKFPQFQNCEGYWKLLIDFKMYDNEGVGSPQMVVKPEFSMDEAKTIMKKYEGGHRAFPVAQDVVDDFVKQYEGRDKMLLSKRDTEYLELAKDPKKNEARLREMVYEAAKEAGYTDDSSWRMAHSAPNSTDDVSLDKLKESELVPDDFWEHPEWYTHSFEERESFYKVKKAIETQERRTSEGNPRDAHMWVYRAVDKTKNTKEDYFRNGDWVTPSYDYAVNEGKMNPNGYRIIKHSVSIKHLYWDGNSIAELGYDDGNNYAYADTLNNRKLLDTVTYDDDGNVIPLSKRFKRRNYDVRFSKRNNTSVYDIMGETERIRKENEKLKADVERLRERLKLEGKVTKGRAFNDNHLLQAAGHLRNIGKSSIDKVQLARMMKEFYTFITDAEDVMWEDVWERSSRIAESILAEAKPEVEVNDYYKTILKDIQNTKISFSESQKKEAQYRFGKNWNRYFFGRTSLRNDGVSLDSQWKEWSSQYPDIFDADVTENDMVSELYDIIGDLQDSSEIVKEYDETEAIRWMAAEVYNQFWNISRIETTADKYNKKIKELNAEHRKTISEIRADYNERAKDKADKQKLVDDMYYGRILLEKDKEVARQKLADDIHYGKMIRKLEIKRANEVDLARRHGREMMDKYKENAEKKTRIQRITANALTLNTWLKKNSKDYHIHDAMKGPVIKLLNALDFSSKRMLEKGVATQKDTSFAEAFAEVRTMLDDATHMVEGLEELYGHDLAEDIKKLVETTYKLVGDNNYIINAMSVDELKSLDKLVRYIKKIVSEVNRFHVINHNQGAVNLANEFMEHGKRLGNIKKQYGKIGKSLKFRNRTPYYFFKDLGSVGERLFEAFQDGWDKLAFNAKKVIDYAAKTYDEKEVKAWSKETKEFKLKQFDGTERTFEMSIAQIMALHCVSKQQDALNHLLSGGMTLKRIDKKGKVVADYENINLTVKDIQEILSTLTDRQIEVADKLQNFMNTVCSDWGNEISMARFGIEQFGLPDYFPIKVSEATIPGDNTQDIDNASLFRLLNMSFTKARNENADQSIEIGDVFDIFAQHASDMAKYNALALPVLDFNKFYSIRDRDSSGKEYGVVQTLKTVFGDEANGYIRRFVRDLNGSQNVSRDVLGNTFFKNAKVASVAANLRVVLLQPTAFYKASAVLDNKYLMKASAYLKSEPIGMYKRFKKAIANAEKYCGIVQWKSLGYYDTDISKGLTEKIKHSDSLKDKAIEKSMKGAEIADKLTFGTLWVACEYEIRDTHKDLRVGSKEFYDAIAKRLREVIYATQVVDSTMTRSDMMRSSDRMDKMLTTFGSEPTIAYNMLLDMVSQYGNDKKEFGKKEAIKRNAKKIRKVVTAYVITNAVAALVETGFDAFRSGDDEEKELEAFMKNYFKNFALDMSIGNKLPVVKDVYSLMQGYSSSRMDSQWAQYVQLALNAKKPEKSIKYTIRAFSQLSGLPVYNVYRDLMAALDFFDIFTAEDINEMFGEVED